MLLYSHKTSSRTKKTILKARDFSIARSFTGAEAAGAVLSPVVEAEDGPQEDREDPLTIYPEGGYWALAPGARLRMLRALCCDALDTALIRCPFTGPDLTRGCSLGSHGMLPCKCFSYMGTFELARRRPSDACPSQVTALCMSISILQSFQQWQIECPLHNN